MQLDTSPVPDYPRLGDLTGQVFAVMGGGQGIGRQAVHALAQAGATVACVGRRKEPTEHVANEVGGIAFLGDAQNSADVERLFSTLKERCGRVDGVVDIIAQGLWCSVESVTPAEWKWQYDNVIGHALLALQLGAPYMDRGCFTFCSSALGSRIFPGLHSVAYGTSKAALNQLVRIAAAELGPKGIRVNAVSPALVRTPRFDETQTEEWFAAAALNYPVRRIADPSDIASVILFLSSTMSRHVTGQVIDVDGGIGLISPEPFPTTGFTGAKADISEDGTLTPQRFSSAQL